MQASALGTVQCFAFVASLTAVGRIVRSQRAGCALPLEGTTGEGGAGHILLVSLIGCTVAALLLLSSPPLLAQLLAAWTGFCRCVLFRGPLRMV